MTWKEWKELAEWFGYKLSDYPRVNICEDGSAYVGLTMIRPKGESK